MSIRAILVDGLETVAYSTLIRSVTKGEGTDLIMRTCFSKGNRIVWKKVFFFFFFFSTLSTRFELIYHTYLARTCDFIEVSIRFLLFPFLDRSLTVKVCQLAGNWLPPSNQSVHRLIVLNQIQFAIVFTLISSDEHCFSI